MTVTDDLLDSDTQTLDISVANAAPTLSAITATAVAIDEGESITFATTYSDPSWLGTHTAALDCGDANPTPDSLSISDGEGDRPDATGTITGVCTYVDNGDFTVAMTATDDLGGSDSQTLDITVATVGASQARYT